MANLLIAIRLLLAAPSAWLITRADGRSAALALTLWAVAVVTDYFDGQVARRTGTATVWVATFDHTTDFVFVTASLIGGVYAGVFPWLLPVLAIFAFSQYTLDSYLIHRAHMLRGSKLGRYNGLGYYAPAALECLIRLGWHWVQPILTILLWVLVVSTVISISERLVLSWRARPKACAF